MHIDSKYYIHPWDRRAMKALKAIPGFHQLMKAFMSVWNEKLFVIQNMSSNLRINENQLKKYYDMLPPICEKLGIDIPDMYVELDVAPNAYTYGDTKPFIVITSGLLERFPDELVEVVIAHECGHIACHHTLYTTMANLIVNGVSNFANGLVTDAVVIGLMYWKRCSEFSADRAAIIYDGGYDRVTQMCMRFAGFDDRYGVEPNLSEFLNQAEAYKEFVNNGKINKLMELGTIAFNDHPLIAVRASEAVNWANGEDGQRLFSYFDRKDDALLSNFSIPVPGSSKSFIGKDYKDVIDEFKNAGFDNVSSFEVFSKDRFKKSGDVLDISIDGKDSFNEEDWFHADSSVSIRYKE